MFNLTWVRLYHFHGDQDQYDKGVREETGHSTWHHSAVHDVLQTVPSIDLCL